MKNEDKSLYLIDGNSLCYRAFYAIKELSTSKGFPTNAIYGFVNMLRKIIKDHEPDMMAVVFDMAGPTERHLKYEEYKIHREPMPDALADQMDRIKEVVEAYNIPVVRMQGYEADDIIATIADKSAKKGINVTIVSNDKDALQLVNDRIKVFSPHPMGDKLYDEAAVEKKYGVHPGAMVEMMALMGDQSDNVPGVKGVGQVTAAKLVKEYGTVADIYRNIGKIGSDSLKKKLLESRDMAALSRELVELDRNVPVKVDIEEMKRAEPDNERLAELFSEFEFSRMIKELLPKTETPRGEYRKISPGRGPEDILKGVKKAKKFSFMLDGENSGIEGIGLAWEKEKALYIPLSDSRFRDVIGTLMNDKDVLKIGFDLKEDIRRLKRLDIDVAGEMFDVLIAGYLDDPSRPGYDLEDMARRMTGYNLSSGKGGAAWDEKGQATLDLSAAKDITGICERCDVLVRLHEALEDALREKDLVRLFREVEMPLVNVIADMEEEGVGIDTVYLEEQSRLLEKDLEALTGEIYRLAGGEFNINSPKQLQVVLYDKLGLPAGKKTKTGRSTDESVLKKLAGMHELPAKLLEYREMNKLKSGYYDSIRDLVDKNTGKLHPRFNQAVTATGRLSSSEPNIQNIPVKTPLGRKIRKAFNPGEKGSMLLAADYSQVELRVLAHLSGDKKLVKAFSEGEDVHSYTASLIFDTEIDRVTPEMRAAAKTVNFGIIYGLSAFGLSKDLKIRIDDARHFIDSYFNRYSGVRDFIDRTIEDARKDGYVKTILDRRRYIPEINSGNEHVRNFAERAAVNTPVQGSAADLIKLAMIKCHEEFLGTEVRMIIQVHDELVFKVPAAKVGPTARKVRDIMEGVMRLKVPLKVDIETGPNWYDMEDIKL